MKNSYYRNFAIGCKTVNRLLCPALLLWCVASCTVSKQIGREAKAILLQDSIIGTGHLGISIYEPATNTYLYDYNANRYFIPASNTKLFTLYAGMKYLGDSLTGLRYKQHGDGNDAWTDIKPTGDPTFLDPDFLKQPVFDFLKQQQKLYLHKTAVLPYGRGWAWDDHNEKFMTPRAVFPMYKNVMTVNWINTDSVEINPSFFTQQARKFFHADSGINVYRDFGKDRLLILPGVNKTVTLPFYLDWKDIETVLQDTLPNLEFLEIIDYPHYPNQSYRVIHSQPADSLFRPMMQQSNNFFAEQTLLMVSNEQLGLMNDEAIIDTLLKTDFKDIPQQPGWADGSGLSRYNLFTPQSFVYILKKLKNEFDWERLKAILPTGGQGTLKNYYLSDSGFIYAKTGSMSNQVTLSGYLITRKNRLLIFSILANNVVGHPAAVRRSMERFIKRIRSKH
jgi:D-alanyl-D-alanine carboxypeptidase/D-alanyl-D-alanine-endopeptidase (penicillin-binding protein 4)